MNPTLGLFLFLVISWNCCYSVNGSPRKGRIYGGYYDYMRNVPYMAQLLYKGKLFCGASIISNRWLLTAAHCIYNENINDLTVATGRERRESGGSVHEIVGIIMHEGFNHKTLHNDIALIELAESREIDVLEKPVLFKPTPPQKEDVLVVSGYGKKGQMGEMSEYIKSMKVFFMDNEECQKKYEVLQVKIKDEMFCTDSPLSDACEGDSGGPAVIDGKLAGIVSFGGNCEKFYPGVYTNVFKYHEWISKNTGIQDLLSE